MEKNSSFIWKTEIWLWIAQEMHFAFTGVVTRGLFGLFGFGTVSSESIHSVGTCLVAF